MAAHLAGALWAGGRGHRGGGATAPGNQRRKRSRTAGRRARMKPGDGDCAALALGWEGSSGGQRRHADGPGAPRRPRKTRGKLARRSSHTWPCLSLDQDPRPPRELESPGIPTGSETRRDGKDDRTEEEKGQEKKKKKRREKGITEEGTRNGKQWGKSRKGRGGRGRERRVTPDRGGRQVRGAASASKRVPGSTGVHRPSVSPRSRLETGDRPAADPRPQTAHPRG